jgi:hypothetical protein
MTRTNARTLDTARQQPLGAGVTSVQVGQSVYAPPGTVIVLSPQTQQQLASQNLQASLSSVYASQAIYNKILTISLASQRGVT